MPRNVFLFLVLAFTAGITCAQVNSIPDTTVKTGYLQEVVVTASRISEKQLSAPVSVSTLSTEQIRQTAATSFFDAIGTMKGVHMITPSLGFKIINTRGFSNTTNVRFVQMIDNIDNQSPHIGAPIANALSPSDLDIDHVEIVQGVASALYGMNATNGLANFITKDPFIQTGLSVQQQTAVNHIGDPNNVSPKLYSETNLRWAQTIGSKWAIKLTAGFNKGYDWIADDNTDINPLANLSTDLLGANNPGYDGVNKYGNESSNRKTLTFNGKNYVVARTGYAERDVADYNLQNSKGDLSLYYRPNSHATLSYTYRIAFLNSIYQRSNRFRLEHYLLQQQILQYKSRYVQSRLYLNSENTGDSYNLRSMAENIDNSFKNPTKWFNDYSSAYKNAVDQNNDVATAHNIARSTADNGRLIAGTAVFNDTLARLQQINNWNIGAALKVKAHLVHGETSVDIGKLLQTKINLQAGFDFRDYIIVPDGNYFINPTKSGANINYSSFGIFVHASHAFINNKLRLSAALRMSDYKYADVKLNPRLTAVYNMYKSQFVRLSFQTGYRYPSIFEGFSNINSGGVKRIGGLKVMSNGVFEYSWLKSSIDAFQAAVNKDINTGGLSQIAAFEKNKGLLKKNTYTYIKPEQMNSFELGYRAVVANNKLFIDADVYFNNYKNFIAQIEASVPNTSDSSLVPAYLFERNKQARYRLWTNSKSVVHNYGLEIDLSYILNSQINLFANSSYQALKKTNQDDGLEDGFNTPKWIVNSGITVKNVYKMVGATASAKYQSRFYWQSFLVNGNVPPFFSLDAALFCRFSKAAIDIKLGGSNLLNHYYHSILGGPQIGGFYYATITYGIR
jgi:iron complex outermembrane receptor protein